MRDRADNTMSNVRTYVPGHLPRLAPPAWMSLPRRSPTRHRRQPVRRSGGSGSSFWFSTEYILPKPDPNDLRNWGARVLHVGFQDRFRRGDGGDL